MMVLVPPRALGWLTSSLLLVGCNRAPAYYVPEGDEIGSEVMVTGRLEF